MPTATNVKLEALTRDEVIYLRKAVKILLGLRTSQPPTHGLSSERRRYLDKLAITFTSKQY